ncbi:hypothetical protein BJ973_002496 [Actinoplanes tereljensis]|uniref:Uncharacterized protein n=1 Tax=Paractinoplanes tereljensis TaxID=571912 RepID=A0A919NNL5_9ACTN|nr:hypothetical protein [Actinoplanes tereljensis]GIF22171.1 hypothetical protein Ate02nite_49010 [Actinoplanes tereljensis]
MSMRIGNTDGTRWESHIASIHLTTDWRRLNADAMAGADQRVIAADKAAIVESRHEYAQVHGRTRFDVTV